LSESISISLKIRNTIKHKKNTRKTRWSCPKVTLWWLWSRFDSRCKSQRRLAYIK